VGEANSKRWRAERGTPVEEKAAAAVAAKAAAERPAWEWAEEEEALARGRREVRSRRSARPTVMAGARGSRACRGEARGGWPSRPRAVVERKKGRSRDEAARDIWAGASDGLFSFFFF
jgi:hypothetical protein